MIKEGWTLVVYGYTSDAWAPKSHKPVIAECDGCGVIREVMKGNYRDLCKDCYSRPSRGICTVCGIFCDILAKQMCKKCYGKAYREANKMDISAKAKAYHVANREVINTKSRVYRENNRELVNMKSRAYHAAHTEEEKAYNKANKLWIRARKKVWADANKDIIRAKKREYSEANKTEIRRKNALRYKANKEEVSTKSKKYYESNKEVCKIRASIYYENNRAAVLIRQDAQRRAAGALTRAEMRGENHPHWRGGISIKYCEKWTEALRQSIRDQYGNCDYLSGIHMDVCNKGVNLDVHHVDYNKAAGCDGSGFKLVPLSRSNHARTNANRQFWNALFIYALAYEEDRSPIHQQIEDMWVMQ